MWLFNLPHWVELGKGGAPLLAFFMSFGEWKKERKSSKRRGRVAWGAISKASAGTQTEAEFNIKAIVWYRFLRGRTIVFWNINRVEEATINSRELARFPRMPYYTFRDKNRANCSGMNSKGNRTTTVTEIEQACRIHTGNSGSNLEELCSDFE
jgi:hypothetical protein